MLRYITVNNPAIYKLIEIHEKSHTKSLTVLSVGNYIYISKPLINRFEYPDR